MLNEMAGYWRLYPPLHEVVAKYLGAGEAPAKDADADELARELGLTLPPIG